MTKYAPFLIFEGIDHCGKTTQLRRTADFLAHNQIPFVTEKEPGSTALGGTLRRLLKEPVTVYNAMNATFTGHPDFTPLDVNQVRTGLSEMHLFLAARSNFLELLVRPRLEKGITVLADRCGDSTETYQGGGTYEGNTAVIAHIRANNAFLFKKAGVPPGLTFLLDIPYEVMMQRAQGDKLDAFESRGKDYFDRVRAAYLTLAREEPGRITLIDGTLLPDTIFTEHIEPALRRLYKL